MTWRAFILIGEVEMLRHTAPIKMLSALTFIALLLFADAAFGQEAPLNKLAAAAAEPTANKSENKAAAGETRRRDLQIEVESLRAENAAVRELLQKMADQQKALSEQVDRLQRKLDANLDGTAQTRISTPAQTRDAAS